MWLLGLSKPLPNCVLPCPCASRAPVNKLRLISVLGSLSFSVFFPSAQD